MTQVLTARYNYLWALLCSPLVLSVVSLTPRAPRMPLAVTVVPSCAEIRVDDQSNATCADQGTLLTDGVQDDDKVTASAFVRQAPVPFLEW